MKVLFTCIDCPETKTVPAPFIRRYVNASQRTYSVYLGECYLPEGWDEDRCPKHSAAYRKKLDEDFKKNGEVAIKNFTRTLRNLSTKDLLRELSRDITSPDSTESLMLREVARRLEEGGMK